MKKLLSIILAASMLMFFAITAVFAVENEGSPSEKDDFFKVLLIGNSLSDDASDAGYTEGSTLQRILKSMLGEETKVAVGLMWSGGKSLAWHATVAEYGMTEGQHYTFGYIEDGKNWTYVNGVDSTADALSYTDWDAVVLQPYGAEVKRGKATFANEEHSDFLNLTDSVSYMLDHISEHAPGADAYLYQIHADAYADNANNVFDVERDVYDKICKNIRKAENCAGSKSGKTFKDTIPVGAAIQAARGTYLAKLDFNSDASEVEIYTDPQIGLQRDGVHLTFEIGRYIAGLTFAEVLIPESERRDGYILAPMRVSDLVGEMPEEYHEIARLAVSEALASAKLSGDKKYNVKAVKGFEESPMFEIGAEISAIGFKFEAPETAEELEGLIVADISEKCGDDIACKVTFKEEYTQPADGETVTVGADVSFRYGYLTGSCSVTAEIYRPKAPVVNPFEDVSVDDWFYNDVMWAYETELMKGMSDVTFAPEASMTRAMLVTVLWRTEGSPEPESASPFEDLKEDWYLKSVAWAYENEIVKGTGETEFSPDGVITREQIAAIFYRYAGFKGYNTDASADLSAYPDTESISEYALSAVMWANAEGLINGTNEFGTTILNPLGDATRAQCAAIFNRFLKKY